MIKVGDLVYFEPHRATGILLERIEYPDNTETQWKYALMSPRRRESDRYIVSIKISPESKFIENIESGYLDHYVK